MGDEQIQLFSLSCQDEQFWVDKVTRHSATLSKTAVDS